MDAGFFIPLVFTNGGMETKNSYYARLMEIAADRQLLNRRVTQRGCYASFYFTS